MGGLDVFEQGLYGSREMFIFGFLELYQIGILKREVYPDEIVQRLVNEGKISPGIDKNTLAVLLEAGAVHPQLDHPDVDWLRKFGIFKETVTYEDGSIRVNPDLLINADLTKGGGMDAVVQHCLGDRLKEGIVMHGGFFLGPHKFYESLRNMDAVERKKFCMTSVMFLNQLYGNPSLATLQRTDARYFNTCMMMTLGGAVCSDGLENGKVVSGVGGQYNFVAMAHELPGARSILAEHHRFPLPGRPYADRPAEWEAASGLPDSRCLPAQSPGTPDGSTVRVQSPGALSSVSFRHRSDRHRDCPWKNTPGPSIQTGYAGRCRPGGLPDPGGARGARGRRSLSGADGVGSTPKPEGEDSAQDDCCRTHR